MKIYEQPDEGIVHLQDTSVRWSDAIMSVFQSIRPWFDSSWIDYDYVDQMFYMLNAKMMFETSSSPEFRTFQISCKSVLGVFFLCKIFDMVVRWSEGRLFCTFGYDGTGYQFSGKEPNEFLTNSHKTIPLLIDALEKERLEDFELE
jgi:hypothetical protein